MRSVSRVAPADLYRLRWLHLHAEKKALEAQQARNLVREAVLRLEARYHLLASEASLDAHTGVITRTPEEVSSEPLGNESAGPQGPA